MSKIAVVIIVKSVYFKSDPCFFNKYGIRYCFTIRFIGGINIIQKAEYFSQTVTKRRRVEPIIASSIILPPNMDIYRYCNYRCCVCRYKRPHH